MLRFGGSSDIKNFVKRYLAQIPLQGLVVVDIPAGKGDTSRFLHQAGAEVHAYDLFPEVFAVDGVSCREADLMEGVPEADGSVDMVICQEGIEHLPNQLSALREFNRILKPGGRLVITAPNISHLRGKISNLLVEGELSDRMPANELDALWYAGDGKMYFGHLFLIGIQKLRVLAKVSGFRLKKIHTVKASKGSLLYAPLYPVIVLANLWAYAASLHRKDGIAREDKRRVYKEQLMLNLHPGILFGRHLFVEFEKMAELNAVDVSVLNARY